MPTPDELADALWRSESRWVNKMTHITHSYTHEELRTLARKAAKEALNEVAKECDEFAEHEFEVPHASEMIRARAERIGKETDG